MLSRLLQAHWAVERTGRGVSIIYSGQLRNGRPAPNYDLSTEVSVNVTLYGGPADLDFVQLILNEENRLGRLLTVSELLILDYIHREREIKIATAAELTQRTGTDARAILETLLEAGLLKRRGVGRNRTYHLSAGVYRELGRPAAYVRARGFEPLQMEEMIWQYVRAHQRITRRDVMELCRVTKDQARYLLKKLVEKNDLELVGGGRYAYYKIGESRKNSE